MRSNGLPLKASHEILSNRLVTGIGEVSRQKYYKVQIGYSADGHTANQ